MSNDELFQLEDEDRNGACPFVMIHGPEIVDGRLSDGEKILLFWLRLRSRKTKGQNTWVSWRTIAQDLGINESTVKRRAKKLRELGWIKCKTRGYSKSKKKFLRRASSMYGDGLWSWDFWDWCVHERSQEQIDELRSIGGKNDPNDDLDNAKNDPLGAKTTHHKGQKRPIIRGKNDPPEEEKKKKKKNESESLNAGSQSSTEPPSVSGVGFSDGDPYDTATGEVIQPKDYHPGDFGQKIGKNTKKKEIHVTPESPALSEASGDERRAAALLIAASAGSRATKLGKEALAKREAKREARERSGEAEEADRMRAMTKKDRQTVGGKLHEYCRTVFNDQFPDVRWGKWMKVEYSQARKLLEAYDRDVELIERAWKYICENWDAVRKKLKLEPGVPTIGFLLAFKDRIFPVIQEYETTAQNQEAQSLSGKFEW